MIQGFDIVCFSTADWDTALPTNKHQIMTRLARANRVLFVETLGTRTVRWASGTDVGRIRRRLGRALAGPRRVPPAQWPVGAVRGGDGSGGLWVLSPLVWPRWSRPAVATLNRLVLRVQLARAVARLGFRNPIVWCYSPHAVEVLDTLDPRTVLYHVVDDLSAVPGAESEALRRAEIALLRRADHVVCTEEKLHILAKEYNPGAVLMENVADFEHFAAPPDEDALAPETRRALDAIRALPAPRLLFSGHLAAHKVDFDLLLEIKRRHPEWSLILAGPKWEGAAPPEAMRRLEALPGVLLVGRIEYRDLPAVLRTADVLLIPYRINEVTRHVSPLKFYEYAATGKPLVATPLPSILRYAEAVPLESEAGRFVEAVAAELRAPERTREARLAIARAQTWAQRIEDISRLLSPDAPAR